MELSVNKRKLNFARGLPYYIGFETYQLSVCAENVSLSDISRLHSENSFA
jgi:hypothetical protein